MKQFSTTNALNQASHSRNSISIVQKSQINNNHYNNNRNNNNSMNYNSNNSKPSNKIIKAPIQNTKIVEKNSTELKEKLARVLPKIIKNIIIKNKDEKKIPKTSFDCQSQIRITFEDYLIRLIKYSHAESSTLIYSLCLIDAISATRKVIITSNNIHKLFFTALMISIKLLEDEIYVEKHYSSCAGLSSEEMAILEHEFLKVLDFDIIVKTSKFNTYLQAFM